MLTYGAVFRDNLKLILVINAQLKIVHSMLLISLSCIRPVVYPCAIILVEKRLIRFRLSILTNRKHGSSDDFRPFRYAVILMLPDLLKMLLPMKCHKCENLIWETQAHTQNTMMFCMLSHIHCVVHHYCSFW